MTNTTAPQPTPERAGICPFCGGISKSDVRCDSCTGLLDPLSRQATQNDMGPWFIRDPKSPFRPGCSFQRVVDLITRGRIGPATILRGPSTMQFWMPARRVPGVAQLLGVCHSCQKAVSPTDSACTACGASFAVSHDRQLLGLGPIRPLPGQAAPDVIAAAHAVPQGSRHAR